MSMSPLRVGTIRGTGAAVNVELGWIPDAVWISNGTDGDLWTVGFTGFQMMTFTGGGTNIIKKRSIIKGATSGAAGEVIDVILDSGSFAAGNAAGWIMIDPTTVKGTFAAEKIYMTSPAQVVAGVDDADIAAPVYLNQASAAAVAGATGNAAIAAYIGDAATGKAKGFTVGLTVSEANKLLFYVAFRNIGGAQMWCANSLPLA